MRIIVRCLPTATEWITSYWQPLCADEIPTVRSLMGSGEGAQVIVWQRAPASEEASQEFINSCAARGDVEYINIVDEDARWSYTWPFLPAHSETIGVAVIRF